MEKERQSNYELLRIISMFLIVLCHVINYGHIIEHCTNGGIKIIFEVLILMTMIHVNSYVLVTGYFQSKSKFHQSKLWSIIGTTFVYRVLIIVIFSILGIRKFTTFELFMNFNLPNFNYYYWFINKYILLYCLSPFLNIFIKHVSKKDFQKLLITLIILGSILPYFVANLISYNNGFTLYSFIILYLIGAYLREYPLDKSYIFARCSKNLFQIITLSISIGCVFMNFILTTTSLSLVGINEILDVYAYNIYNMRYAYSNPFIMLQTISFFAFISTLNIKNKFINHVSKLTFAVYVIHENEYVRPIIYKLLKIDIPNVSSYKFIIYVIFIAVLIFVTCLIIEEIRQFFNKLILNTKICKKIRQKYYNYINEIKFNNPS